jgi:hypothetical protein
LLQAASLQRIHIHPQRPDKRKEKRRIIETARVKRIDRRSKLHQPDGHDKQGPYHSSLRILQPYQGQMYMRPPGHSFPSL